MAGIGSSHTPPMSSLTVVLRCSSLPEDSPALFSEADCSRPAADHYHVHHHLLLKHQGVPMWLPEAKITSLARDWSCKPSHLSPCPHFQDLLPPRLLFSCPSSHPHTIRPKERCHSGQVGPPPTLSQGPSPSSATSSHQSSKRSSGKLDSWQMKTSHRTFPFLLSPLLPAAPFSSSNLLLMFAPWLHVLLLSCCTPASSLPDSCMTQ